MSEHKVTLKWERGGVEFSYLKYPRDHTWSFDGGHTMKATAAPAYVGNPAYVDPEEAFVASLSSCHMLTFLAIACRQKFVLDSYEDEAVGHLGFTHPPMIRQPLAMSCFDSKNMGFRRISRIARRVKV
jgi:organic hydroperoxide reductase OsmC/OhrA